MPEQRCHGVPAKRDARSRTGSPGEGAGGSRSPGASPAAPTRGAGSASSGPPRCSSVAHTSTTAGGWSPTPSRAWSPALFKGRSPLGAGGFGMARPGRPGRGVEPVRVEPVRVVQGGIPADWSARAHAARPRPCGWSGPPPAAPDPQARCAVRGVGRARAGSGTRAGVRGRALIARRRLSRRVEAARDSSDPIRRLACHRRHLIRRVAPRQPPEGLPVAALGTSPAPR
jgi:hypothetical protein